jgi:hypothetical protein
MAVPAPPTNIFLQNTSSSPFLIEIEDNSGLLEVVTKAQPVVSPEKTQQSEERDETNADTPAKCTSTFRISAVSFVLCSTYLLLLGTNVVSLRLLERNDCGGDQIQPTPTWKQQTDVYVARKVSSIEVSKEKRER